MQTLEMYEAMYKMMIEAAKKGKDVRLNATEYTSYINIMNMVKKGLFEIKENLSRKWQESVCINDYDDDEIYYDDDENENNNKEQENKTSEEIIMHDMILKVNREKVEEELKRIQQMLEKRTEKRIFDRALDEK